MKLVWILLFSFVASVAEGQDYRVVSHKEYAEVINTRFGYKVDAPRHWTICLGSPNPIVISYPPRLLRYAQMGPPKGGAELAFSNDETQTYPTGSIDAWIEEDTGSYGLAEKKDLDKSINSNFVHAVRVNRYDDVGDSYHEEVIHWIEVYFEFNGHIMKAELSYHANDPKARVYEKMFDKTLRSFKKLP